MSISKSLITFHNKNSSATESFKKARTNLLFMNLKSEHPVFVITSTKPGEGKSTTACNLAYTFSKTNYKTLLIDADMRKPTIANFFGIDMGKGLSDILDGKAEFDDCVQIFDNSDLHILTSGVATEEIAELILSNKYKNLIESLREKYDYIIIDAPPTSFLTDASLLSKYSDGVIFVVSDGKVSFKELNSAKEDLEKIGIKILGVIFNKVGTSGKDASYHYIYNYRDYIDSTEEKGKKKFNIKKWFSKK